MISLFLLLIVGIVDQSKPVKQYSLEIQPAPFDSLESLPDSCFDKLARSTIYNLWQQKSYLDSTLYAKGWLQYGKTIYRKFMKNEFENARQTMLIHFPYDTLYFNYFVQASKIYLAFKMNDHLKDRFVLRHLFQKYLDNADSIKAQARILFNNRLPVYDKELEKLKWFILFYPTENTKK
jgi:hypothetical protein